MLNLAFRNQHHTQPIRKGYLGDNTTKYSPCSKNSTKAVKESMDCDNLFLFPSLGEGKRTCFVCTSPERLASFRCQIYGVFLKKKKNPSCTPSSPSRPFFMEMNWTTNSTKCLPCNRCFGRSLRLLPSKLC